jgi:hypothetical protein
MDQASRMLNRVETDQVKAPPTDIARRLPRAARRARAGVSE